MELSNQILSEITVHMKYARYLEDKQRRSSIMMMVILLNDDGYDAV